MNCYLHADVPAVAYCRSCGRALCEACQRTANGTVYCVEHLPVSYADPQNPYAQPVGAPLPASAVSTSPGLAFALGFIPGVGAIYNQQYLKGLVHAIIFGLIVSLIDAVHGPGQPLLGICLMAFVFYMPFEAYHTAKRRQLGQPVDEFSSFLVPTRISSQTPIGPILLILVGILFLLDTLHLVEFRDIARFWPLLLIGAGAFMLYNRMSGIRHSGSMMNPPTNEYTEHHP